MRITRSHIDLPLQVEAEIDLPPDVVAHLGRVLRLGVGDRFVLFNGDGTDYLAELSEIDKRKGRARIVAAEPRDNESPLQITLVQSIARGEKMDWILQKATELGVHAVQPVYSQRGEVRLDAQRAVKRLDHWRQVMISACEQSGRAVVPVIAAPVELSELRPASELRLILEPTATLPMRDLQLGTGAAQRLTLAIGPEGGWSAKDLQQLNELGFRGIRLGPRVFRTETAGLAAIAALQTLHGDF